MVNIPTNNNQSNIDSQVEELSNELVKRLNGGNYAGLGFPPDEYDKGALRKVLQLFKDKGWYAYYHERFDGAWIGIQIYSYEYQPSNRGLNKLYLY